MSSSTRPGSLPWEDLEGVWFKDKKLREIPYTKVTDTQWLIGWEGRYFAVLVPGPEEGQVHVQDMDYDGATEGRVQFSVGDVPNLITQLNLAATGAYWRNQNTKEQSK